jgi:D-serine deaminase-like pyridoxal phosphate-dependent protein
MSTSKAAQATTIADRLNIEKPTLLLNKQQAIRNIEKMVTKAHSSGVRLRPHFKTHRSAAIGEWFRDFGIEAITVSSVDMALYFAESGWKDITIAFPVNLLQIEKINELARTVKLGLLVEDAAAVRFLDQNLTAEALAWIKVDTGYGRTGIAWDRSDAMCELAQQIEGSDRLLLTGLLTHAGHSYHATSKAEIASIHQESVGRMRQAQAGLVQAGLPTLALSIGDTPTCSIVDHFSGVDEIRPGNFVFYDLMQVEIGSCTAQEIAVAVACPVVAKHAERNEIVLYGGAVHLSKESFVNQDGIQMFGHVSFFENAGWGSPLPDTFVSSLSQEHGIVRTTAEVLSRVHVGDVLAVLPVHSCLLAYLLKEYHTLDGEILTSQSSICVPA